MKRSAPATRAPAKPAVDLPAGSKLELQLSGLPGVAENVIAVAHKVCEKNRKPDNPAGSPGKYQVTFIFSRPTSGYSEREISIEPSLEGDSFIKWAATPPPDAKDFTLHVAGTIDGKTVEFDLKTNKQNFLGRAESDPFTADSFQKAEDLAYRAIAPTLSHWSAELDVPIQVFRVHSIELATQSRRVGYWKPFEEVFFSPAGMGQLGAEFQFYASIYREAISSNSPAYQFLCYFKIIEGIRRRRVRLDKEAVERGEKPNRPVERIPESREDISTWLDGLFRLKRKWDEMAIHSIVPDDALGRKVGHLVETLDDVRNSVAHSLTEKDELRYMADEKLHPAEVTKWLPLIRCIARLMMKNDFPGEFLKT